MIVIRFKFVLVGLGHWQAFYFNEWTGKGLRCMSSNLKGRFPFMNLN